MHDLHCGLPQAVNLSWEEACLNGVLPDPIRTEPLPSTFELSAGRLLAQ